MAKKIVIAKESFDEYIPPIRELAAKYGYEVVYEPEPLKVAPNLPDAEVVMGLGRKILDGTTEELKWVAAQSSGIDWYLKSPYRPKHEVTLTNMAGGFGVGVSEHAVMMLLEVLRLQPQYQDFVRKRIFRYDLNVRSIKGTKITVLGTGDLGNSVAKRLRGFEPESITGVNMSGRNPEGLYDRIVKQEDADSILPETQVVILCLPGTPETKGFIDSRRIAMLPRDAVIVNVGRGNAIVQADLIDALKREVISGAALDVFEKEPLKEDDPIYDCPNLVMTPHVSGSIVMEETLKRTFELFYENLENYFEGRPLNNVVDPAKGY